MDIPTIFNAISTIGFPAAMCIILLLQMNKQNEAHRDEITTLTNALNNNTLVVQKLVDKLEVYYEDLGGRNSLNKKV